jgi:hypothetical protein
MVWLAFPDIIMNLNFYSSGLQSPLMFYFSQDILVAVS